MIYWLCILTLIAAIFLYIKVYELVNIDVLEVTIPFTCIILTNINAKPEICVLESSYNTLLEYKSALDSVQNEHYISDIITWNATISSGKSIQRDFWVGIFIPNIYGGFDIITLKED